MNRYIKYLKIPIKLDWRYPKKCDVLIYDNSGKEFINSIFDDEIYKISTLATRLESINVIVFLILITNRKYWVGKIFRSYLVMYIRLAAPKILISFTDNDRNLYEISAHLPKIKILVVQNGRRAKTNDLFSEATESNKWHADYVFVFGPQIKEIYHKYISSNFIVIGSLRNNIAQRKKKKKIVSFISNWRRRPDGDIFYANATYDQFYASEKILLEYLSKWVVSNDYDIAVVGASKRFPDCEKEFFIDQIGHNDFYFSSRENLSSYEIIDKSDFVVSIDSTLGLESLARGNRTAIFPYRGHILGWDDWLFGWPGDYPESGPFWSNIPEEEEFLRVMKFVAYSSDSYFKKISESTVCELIHYDPGNSIIKEIINKILVE